MAITLKSESAKNQVRDLVVQSWRDMKDERSDLESKWKRCMMAFLCEFDKTWVTYAKQAGRSRRYVAITKDAVDTLVPQIYDAILGQDDWLKIMPAREGFNEMDAIWAENQKYLLQHQHRHTGFNRTIKMAIKSLMMLGNCPTTASWYEREVVDYSQVSDAMNRWAEESMAYQAEHKQLMKDYQQMAIQSQLLGESPPPPPDLQEPPRPPIDAEIAFAGPRIHIGSIFNYVQEQHPNDEFEAVRVMRSFRTKAYLKRMAEDDDGYRLYENINKLQETESEETADDNEAESLMKMALGMEMPHAKDKIELKELHGTIEIPSGPEKQVLQNYIATVANDMTLIRCEPAPFFSGRPQIWNARVGIIEGAVYGIGPVEKALDEQDSANAIHNQNIDAVNCVIQPELEIMQDDLADGIMKPSGPGARHMVLERGAISPIMKNFQGIPLGFETLNAAMARHERITGAVNTSTGAEETATRTARNSGIIATKLGSHVTDIEDNLVTECLNMQLEMNAQYITTDQVIAVTKDKKITQVRISPEEVRRGYVAYAAGSKYLAEKQERIQNLMMATQLAVPGPDGRPKPVNEDELYRLLFKEIIGEADNIVMSREEFEAKLAEFQQMQIAMQQGAGNGEGGGGPAEAGGGPQLGLIGPAV